MDNKSTTKWSLSKKPNHDCSGNLLEKHSIFGTSPSNESRLRKDCYWLGKLKHLMNNFKSKNKGQYNGILMSVENLRQWIIKMFVQEDCLKSDYKSCLHQETQMFLNKKIFIWIFYTEKKFSNKIVIPGYIFC